MKEIWAMLQADVFDRASTERLFNPYRDRDDALDVPDAPAVRRENLRRYLGAYDTMPEVFLLAEAPGPWGCRFSGVPITSEEQLLDPDFPVHGRRSSIGEAPHSEYSANIHWRVLAPYFPAFMTWNTVALHPHKPNEPLTIRTPTAGEIDAFESVVDVFLNAIRPRHVGAIGRKAQRALRRLDVHHTYIRHPSQGGAKIFDEQVRELLSKAGIA